MNTRTGPTGSAENPTRNIRRKTRRRFSAEEQMRIVLDGLRGEHSVSELCRREGIAESLYYNWSNEFLEAGKKRLSGDTQRQATSGEITSLKRETRDLKEALAEAILENRLLKAHDLITSPAFIVMKAANEFRDKTTAMRQLWQTDFTYLKVIGWGWFHLSTILDDYSRYIISWKLRTSMAASDVQDTLNLTLEETGLGQANVVHRRRLLSDYLEDKGMTRTRGAPYHPQTQGKIERWHQTFKNHILLRLSATTTINAITRA